MSEIFFTAWGYGVSYLEFISVVTSFVGVWLGTTGKRITWPWWALSSALYMAFFYEVKLYASAALQIVFILAAIWGWRDWAPSGAVPSALTRRQIYLLSLGTLVTTAALTPILSNIGAAATWSDAFLLIGSLVAQVLMVYEKYESWVLWLIVDAVGTIEYAVLGYWFTALLYFSFTLIAVLGWKRWYVSLSN